MINDIRVAEPRVGGRSIEAKVAASCLVVASRDLRPLPQ